MSSERQEISEEEINKLSTKHKGIARIGAKAEVDYRATAKAGEDKALVAEAADKKATEAIRDFLEDNGPETEVVESSPQLEDVSLSDKPTQQVGSLAESFPRTTVHKTASARMAAMSVGSLSAKSVDTEPQVPVIEQKAEKHPDEEIWGEIFLDNRRLKSVIATRYKNGEKTEFGYDGKGKPVQEKTYDSSGKLIRSKLIYQSETGSTVVETRTPYEEDGKSYDRIVIEREGDSWYKVGAGMDRKSKKQKFDKMQARPAILIDTKDGRAMWILVPKKGKAEFPLVAAWPEPMSPKTSWPRSGGLDYREATDTDSRKGEVKIKEIRKPRTKGDRHLGPVIRPSGDVSPKLKTIKLAESRRGSFLFPEYSHPY